MTRKRRTATPIFQQPLTKLEDAQRHKQKFIIPTPKGIPILCSKCGEQGYQGLHRITEKDIDALYACNDTKRCKETETGKMLIMSQRKK